MSTNDFDTYIDPLEHEKESVWRTAFAVLIGLAHLEKATQTFIPSKMLAISMSFRKQTLLKRKLLDCLNALRRAGYVIRLRKGKESGYRLTKLGWDTAQPETLLALEILQEMRQDGQLTYTRKDGHLIHKVARKRRA